MSSMAMINQFVSQPALALMGMSRSGKKFGNFAYRTLVSKGYRVYPIHPDAKVINGIQCYSALEDLPEHVEDVVIVLPAANALRAIQKAATAGIRRVWLQQGSESPDVLRACNELGLEVISGECILMFARPTSYHKAHRWVWGALGKLPT
jgi:predicted CoA-binding protein